jgi:hypothetical protein
MKQCPWGVNSTLSYSINYSPFMEHESVLPCLQCPSNGCYCKPHESNQHTKSYFLRIHFNIIIHLHLGLLSGLQAFHTKLFGHVCYRTSWSSSASYSRGQGFKSQLGNRLSWGISWFFSVPLGKCGHSMLKIRPPPLPSTSFPNS